MARSFAVLHANLRVLAPMMDRLSRSLSRRRTFNPPVQRVQHSSSIEVHGKKSHRVKSALSTSDHKKENISRSSSKFRLDRSWPKCQCQSSVRSYEASYPDLAPINAGSTSHTEASESESDKEDEEKCLELEEVEMLIGGRRILLAQPRDVDAVIDMYIRQGQLDRDPYWCRPWPSAVALAEEVLSHPELVRGRKVCDLGAGLGLAGVAAALAGSAEVTFYDREGLALLCALVASHCNIPDLSSNVHAFLPLTNPPSLSSLPSFNPIASTLPPLSASSLRDSTNGKMPGGSPAFSLRDSTNGKMPGGSPASAGRVKLEGPCVRGEMLDWSDPKAGSQDFDVVLACDVLYERAAVDLIASLVPRLLKPSSDVSAARLLVSDPVERCPENRREFVRMMEEERGMVLERVGKREPETEGTKQKVELMHFVRRR